MNYKEAVIAAVEYGETVPVLLNGKRVKISVAEKPKASPGQVSSGLGHSGLLGVWLGVLLQNLMLSGKMVVLMSF